MFLVARVLNRGRSLRKAYKLYKKLERSKRGPQPSRIRKIWTLYRMISTR